MGRILLAAALLVAAAGCGERRTVGRTEKPVAATPPPPAVPPPAPVVEAPAPAEPVAEPDLDKALNQPERISDRRSEFARAVAAISNQLGAPISSDKALEEMPCGGWSGPDCTNLTLGIEIAKTCAPIVASFHRKKTADIAVVFAEAISIHSVWHDAYGYVWRKHKVGPGYTYAGCLFSKCDPGDLKNGQVDGILYQVGRLLGLLEGPACGPGCSLAP
jgi:hypothetical protein